jgi:phosphate starvation-inducible PhoH-like protein
MDRINSLGNHEQPAQKSGKKSSRSKPGSASKKQTARDMKEQLFDYDEEVAHTVKSKYENMQYLSHKERTEFDSKFTRPINIHQNEYVNALKHRAKKIVVVSGPAGTGKTLFATEYGVKHFLMGDYDRLVFTRPSVSVDEDLGYLPGSLEEKMAPWIRPIYDILYRFIPPSEVQQLVDNKYIEISPLGYMRGRTFKNAWIVADEMQNSTISQMKMLLTRLGEGSRLVATGDLEQHDRTGEINGLEDFLNRFRGRRSSSISSFEFNKDDIQREQVVREVLDIYSAADIPPNYNQGSNGSESSQSSLSGES